MSRFVILLLFLSLNIFGQLIHDNHYEFFFEPTSGKVSSLQMQLEADSTTGISPILLPQYKNNIPITHTNVEYGIPPLKYLDLDEKILSPDYTNFRLLPYSNLQEHIRIFQKLSNLWLDSHYFRELHASRRVRNVFKSQQVISMSIIDPMTAYFIVSSRYSRHSDGTDGFPFMSQLQAMLNTYLITFSLEDYSIQDFKTLATASTFSTFSISGRKLAYLNSPNKASLPQSFYFGQTLNSESKLNYSVLNLASNEVSSVEINDLDVLFEIDKLTGARNVNWIVLSMQYISENVMELVFEIESNFENEKGYKLGSPVLAVYIDEERGKIFAADLKYFDGLANIFDESTSLGNDLYRKRVAYDWNLENIYYIRNNKVFTKPTNFRIPGEIIGKSATVVQSTEMLYTLMSNPTSIIDIPSGSQVQVIDYVRENSLDQNSTITHYRVFF
jgi:hypothetical protein